jgi:hypothetical protein
MARYAGVTATKTGALVSGGAPPLAGIAAAGRALSASLVSSRPCVMPRTPSRPSTEGEAIRGNVGQ